MNSEREEGPAPNVRFKRRKITHPKRIYTDEDVPSTEPQAPDAETRSGDALSLPIISRDSDNPVPNLRDIIRNRRRPGNRVRDAARKSEAPRQELILVETPPDGQYSSRFVAQTGQVVDRDDTQMTKFVEARLAEQNFRKYGWPIPTHLQATVREIAPDIRRGLVSGPPTSDVPTEVHDPVDSEKNTRMAAGMGKIEEVDIAPMENRTEEKWRRLENGEFEQVATGKVRTGRDGKPRRPPKRRPSEDIRRDQMVEAVLRESKLDYFDAQAPSFPKARGTENNDEAILAQFQAEYYESIEEARQQQRKPTAASGTKGAAEAPKGPKLGGSKSIRAKMRLAQEQAAKSKK
ncbi:hypothetical protein IQ06DRAFT_141655 [Phaeosphaeriaceae sp. SRC1lsM3a]|nr:hypothetical protein IQ06DRAFT_141655 [Stagonospora sp. SRC1lsM3a]